MDNASTQPQSSNKMENMSLQVPKRQEYKTDIMPAQKPDFSYPAPATGPPLPPNRDITPWMASLQWNDHQHWFKRGDLVEFDRNWYKHWGIYFGDGQVAHLTSLDFHATSRYSSNKFISTSSEKPRNHESQSSPPPKGMGSVTVDGIIEVAGKHKFRVHNQVRPSKHLVVRSWDETYALIIKYLEQETLPYCLATMNCEHFATFLRYKPN